MFRSLFWKLFFVFSGLLFLSLVLQILAGVYFDLVQGQDYFLENRQEEHRNWNQLFAPLVAANDTSAVCQVVRDNAEVQSLYVFEVFDADENLIIRYPKIPSDSLVISPKDIRTWNEWAESPVLQFFANIKREFTQVENKLREIYVSGELIDNGDLIGYYCLRHQEPEPTFLWQVVWQGFVVTLIFTMGFGFMIFRYFWKRIRRLIGVIEEFRDGNLKSRARIRTKDEIGKVSGAFNEMANQIEENIETIQKYDTQRREFIANMSHDLRTPLTSIGGYIETLQIKGDRATSDEMERYLGIIEKNTSFISNMIADLLELSKLESGQIKMNFQPIQFDELVSDVVMGFTPLIEKKNIQLTLNAPDEIEQLRLDHHQIERVIQNLYKNAVKFTPNNGFIQIDILDMKDSVQFAIMDSGIGIPPEQLDKVFDRFFRTKESKQNFEGTGLGLAIAREIIRNHGGDIYAESPKDGGAKFCFHLPWEFTKK